MLVKVNLSPTGTSALTTQVVNIKVYTGYIDQIAALELNGFAYTVSG